MTCSNWDFVLYCICTFI